MNKENLNFIEQFIEEDLAAGKFKEIHTRFPPEPNGYLHIGHAKAIVINFEIAKKYGGKTNLRMDDTNPTTEETHYVENIQKDIQWLGYDWENSVKFTSDYFDDLYKFAQTLIKKGLAYVDDYTPEEMAEMRGEPSKPGVESPYRNRGAEENLYLLERMKQGEFPDGSKVLRAKIDMASPNMHMRDPVLYRIKHEAHHRTGEEWCIYPMYDFAHGQSDSIEEISHSLCSLEFKHHRPLYNWFIEQLEIFPSRQIEFARMNVSYMITSKRKLLKLVEGGHVSGWDDPRMPTLAGMRRRGIPAASIRNFCLNTGVAKRDNVQEIELLDFNTRSVLNKTTKRLMVVHDPIKVIITNYPEGQTEMLPAINSPEDESLGSREVPFGREIYIDGGDFQEAPNKKYRRMGPGRDIRLKNAYILHCDDYVKNDDGSIKEIHCSYYPDSKSGSDNSGIKPKGTIHFVAAHTAVDIEVRNYDRLFTEADPTADPEKDYIEFLNPNSLEVVQAKAEPALLELAPGEQVQFMRIGYFCVDTDSTKENPIFNRTVGLRDTWKKNR